MNNTQSDMTGRIVLVGYIAASVALLLFSFTQVDLNLTLSRVSALQTIQKAFQYVGYFQRPPAATLYIGIAAALFAFYYLLITAVRKRTIDLSLVWKLIFTVTGILVWSYPAAFSYDFFNYMFTAKTVLVYHLNPYTITPLQLSPIDPWTNFMRWTHLTSAYTPLWILLSLLPYVIGLGYFILVLFATKFMIAGFYLLACWALSRAVQRIDPKHQALALAIFALNPLIMIESLVSGHNDIVLAAFALLAVMASVRQKDLVVWVYLSLSIAAKFMTIVLVPVFFLRRSRAWMLAAMLAGLAVVLMRREFLPWYWVWIMPFVSLNWEKTSWVRSAVVVSLSLTLSYAPFFFFGEYSHTEQVWKNGIIWTGVIASGVAFVLPVRDSRSA